MRAITTSSIPGRVRCEGWPRERGLFQRYPLWLHPPREASIPLPAAVLSSPPPRRSAPPISEALAITTITETVARLPTHFSALLWTNMSPPLPSLSTPRAISISLTLITPRFAWFMLAVQFQVFHPISLPDTSMALLASQGPQEIQGMAVRHLQRRSTIPPVLQSTPL